MNHQVKLEPVAEHHAPVVQELATSHPAIVKLTRLPEPYPEDGAKEWIQYAVPRHKKGREYSFVVVNSSSEIVGVCGLIVNQVENKAELGYWIGHKYWDQGYATAAVHEALDYAFKLKDFDSIFALPLERNKASRMVLEKNGFKHIETQKNTDPNWEETDRIAVYEISSKEWK